MPVTSIEKKILGTIPFKISFKTVKYLGVWVTQNYNNLLI